MEHPHQQRPPEMNVLMHWNITVRMAMEMYLVPMLVGMDVAPIRY
jgi:hypothetical protein